MILFQLGGHKDSNSIGIAGKVEGENCEFEQYIRGGRQMMLLA
jgi:hypothetical protein